MHHLELPPECALARLPELLGDREYLFIDKFTGIYVTGKPYDTFLGPLAAAAAEEEMMLEQEHPFAEAIAEHNFKTHFCKRFAIEIMHEQFHYYQLCNCTYLHNYLNQMNSVYEAFKHAMIRSAAIDELIRIAGKLDDLESKLNQTSPNGISVRGLVEIGAMMIEKALLDPMSKHDDLLRYVLRDRRGGPCNMSGRVLRFWQQFMGRRCDFLWFMTFLSLCQADPVAFFERTTQGLGKDPTYAPFWNATDAEHYLVDKGICTKDEFPFWWRTDDLPSSPIFRALIEAGMFVPSTLPSYPGYGHFATNDFFVSPNLCLDIVSSGYWGVMSLPMRPVCFPKERIYWTGPSYGGTRGNLYNRSIQQTQLNYLEVSASLMLIRGGLYEYFTD